MTAASISLVPTTVMRRARHFPTGLTHTLGIDPLGPRQKQKPQAR